MKLFSNFILLAISTLALLLVLGAIAVFSLPNVHILEKCFTTTMYEVKLCATGPNYAKLTEISPYVLHAVIASEDGSFYSHEGFDFHEMEESLTANLKSGKIRRGGSTLTQQLAKNVFLGKEKSLWRKVKEAYLAVALERNYNKDFILEKYLNVVEFGPDLYGIKPAAQHYFHKPPIELNPLEAAYLAFLLPNPKVYSKSFASGTLTPFGHKMVKVILKRMSSFGKLSGSAYQTAIAQIDSFPWSGIGMEAFGGNPGYSLEAKFSGDHDAAADEGTIDELLKEDGTSSDPDETSD